MPAPQLLPSNQVTHFYRGGRRIAAFRGGDPEGGPRRPEEWIASMTTMTSERERGLSRLRDGTLLRDAVAADPAGWLGPSHVDSFGASTELLVKLLDAGQRLPVHLHPDRAFARQHLGLPHGKTEAWIILDVDEGARVRLGFTEPMARERLRAMVDAGDSDELVRSLRACDARPGDAVLVPAGVPHCIDAGVFLLELQEPTDLSIVLEAEDMPIEPSRDGHLGLGFDVALDAVRLDALDPAGLDRLVVRREQVDRSALAALLPAAAGPYFRAHRAVDGTTVDAGFTVLVVITGVASLVPSSGDLLTVKRGDAVVVPYAAGPWRLEGPVEAVVCRPPEPAQP
jgi:mannose-6-phosphate isomerase